MKTNQILIRKMAEFKVLQRTSDGMFNATDLLKQWNASTPKKKELKKFFENEGTKDFLHALIIEENLHGQNSAYVKSRASRGENAGTWMHPLLFIDFAMWLNPSFKVKVLRFVYDQLVRYRNEAGDTYRELSSAVASLVGKQNLPKAIQQVAKGINYCVFGNHERNMRNKMAEEKLMEELVNTQKKITFLITDGFLRTFQDVITYLRRTWQNKYQPRILTVNKDA